MSKVEDKSKKPEKRKTHKYKELEDEDIDEDTINQVLGKTTKKSRQRHAFDKVSNDDELTPK